MLDHKTIPHLDKNVGETEKENYLNRRIFLSGIKKVEALYPNDNAIKWNWTQTEKSKGTN